MCISIKNMCFLYWFVYLYVYNMCMYVEFDMYIVCDMYMSMWSVFVCVCKI